MEHYLGVSKEQGLSEAEIGAVESVVMAVSACRIRTLLAEAASRVRREKA